jgi:molecular chaperone GrpE (heat shock protein)
MAFKRQEIREILGEAYTDEIATKLVELHRGVVDPLKDDLDAAKRDATKYKAEADKVPGLQKDLDEAKKGEDWKDKYEKEHQSFEDYKTKIARDAETAKVQAAYKKLLIEEKISEKTLDAVMAATDYSGMKLKDDGTLDGVEDLKKAIDTKWGGFKVQTRQRGQQVDNPPAGAPGGSDSSVREYVRKMHEARYGAPPQQK